VEKPLEYYDNNIHGTLQLLAAMRRASVKTFVFSSSAKRFTITLSCNGLIFILQHLLSLYN